MAYKLVSPFSMHRIVSHKHTVKSSVHDKAEEVGGAAKSKLADHHKTGDHKVSVTRGEVDSFVNLSGTAPLSVEFGHWYRSEPDESGMYKIKYVKGLYIITGAAGLV